MRLLSTRTIVNNVAKQKNMGTRGAQAQDQGQIILTSARTTKNEVVKHTNKPIEAFK